ncbi:hypothetical protein [Campylobacter ureolyticus]|uniref:Phosphatidylglycerophosphate synthase n=1 Tax=Campylobacter ureolyticus TaxID=827 RepID=A0AAE7JQ82_9BACT|nr:hypothetical protein [Campylobacter ureolyticus]MCR8685313.1 hypothetical protein [Campylobacter ureolyticus]MCZ6173145.1 hypothetical protein [Campylobacter ureolyticus]QKF85193.1 hypothetical protein CURT_1776 [Campylobacter ureolyticus]QQY36328.1 hypothetical protein I6I59_03590 [Campylobacter ureolyticus]SUX25390.1 phosphatidylglycerophosphate synthase [Campylobacter ureolyticus]
MDNNKNNALEKLESIGINEIAKTTHIEVDYIRWILQKDFDSLKETNVKAYIKILEREYEVDLQPWLDEFNANNIEDLTIKKETKFNNPLKQKVAITEHKKLPKFLFWLVLLVIIVWVIFNFKLYEIDKFLNFKDNKTEVYSTNSTMIDETNLKLEKTGIEILNLNNKTPEFSLKETDSNNEENLEEVADENESLNALEKLTLLNEDENLSNENLSSENLTDKEPLNENLAKDQKQGINPTEKIWIGIIDLKTGSKTTKTTDKFFEFDLNKDQLILTGHGLFTLNTKEKEEKFNDKNPHRFLIKKGDVNAISYDEFLKLNKGKAW